MGVVNLGLVRGAAGFSRVVAIKRLHPEYSRDRDMRARFAREIWLSARILHAHVVQVLDVIQHDDELLFVMEHVYGETLRSLQLDAAARHQAIPLDIAAGVLVPALHGLHAAHETRDDSGNLLGLVHRDFSPQNLLIGPDGQVKVLDFGIAKAANVDEITRTNRVTGKPGYLSPEQALGRALDARSDVFAAGTVLWETVVGARLFSARETPSEAALHNLLHMDIPPPSRLRQDVPEALDRVILRALERDGELRFQSAKDLALALEAAVAPASAFAVGGWLAEVCEPRLAARRERLTQFRESLTRTPAFEVTDALLFGSESSSQVGLSGSLSEPELPPKAPARGLRASWGWLALCCLLTLPLWFAWQRATRSAVPELRRAESTDAQPAEAAPKEATIALVGRVPSLEPIERAGAEAPAASAPSPVRRAAPRKGSAALARPALRSTTVKKPACDPPTYVDATGIRHFKKECL
jgi:serine/threonine-protein kinase